jgi:hypothetical protein
VTRLKSLSSELSALLRRIDVLRGVGVRINQGHRQALVRAIRLVHEEAEWQRYAAAMAKHPLPKPMEPDGV